MTTTARLLWIETRRSVGLWAFLILAGLAWLAWYIHQTESAGGAVALWPQTSVDIGFAVVFLGPATGGLAAWVAGRDHRRGLDDLLATTPAPATRRVLTLLVATTLWALLAYLAAGLYEGILAAREATWGGPVAPPILIAALAIAVQAAIGYAAGSFAGSALASRLTAGLVPVGLFFAQLLPTLIRGDDVQLGPRAFASTEPYANLSPVEVVEATGGSVFWEPPLEIAWAAAVWLLGLGGLALAMVVLRRRRRSPVAWGTLAAAALAVVVGWTQLVPAPVFALASPTRAIAYEPVCTQRSVPICLHPAYEAVLDETADLVDPLVLPLVGVPGAPMRAEQPRPLRAEPETGPFDHESAAPGTLPIVPADPRTQPVVIAQAAVLALVGEPTEGFAQLTPAQSAIAIWLMEQAGWDTTDEWSSFIPFGVAIPIEVASSQMEGDAIMADVRAAADRFAALSPAERRAWLEANFAALRAGTLTLEDLP